MKMKLKQRIMLFLYIDILLKWSRVSCDEFYLCPQSFAHYFYLTKEKNQMCERIASFLLMLLLMMKIKIWVVDLTVIINNLLS